MGMGIATAPTLQHRSLGTQLPARILELPPADRPMASSIFVALLPYPSGLSLEGIRASLRAGIDNASTFEQFLGTLVDAGIFHYHNGVYCIAPDSQLAA